EAQAGNFRQVVEASQGQPATDHLAGNRCATQTQRVKGVFQRSRIVRGGFDGDSRVVDVEKLVGGLKTSAFPGCFERNEFRGHGTERRADSTGGGIGWIGRKQQARLERMAKSTLAAR